MGSICHGYMCIVLYMKLVWCHGFPEICAQLEEGVGSIWHGYMCIVIYMKLMWWGWGQSAIGICALCYIYLPVDLPSLLKWYAGHLCSGGGSFCHRSMLHHYTSLPIDHRSMLHHYTPSVCPRYLCSRLYVKLMWCSGLQWIYGQLEEGAGVSLS